MSKEEQEEKEWAEACVLAFKLEHGAKQIMMSEQLQMAFTINLN